MNRYIAVAAVAALFALATCGSRDAERASSEAASLEADATTAVGPAEPASGEAHSVTTPPAGQELEKAPR